MINGLTDLLKNIDISEHINNEIKKNEKEMANGIDIDWSKISALVIPILITILKDNIFPWVVEQLENKKN